MTLRVFCGIRESKKIASKQISKKVSPEEPSLRLNIKVKKLVLNTRDS